jgi:hypothetical protein
MDFFVRYKFNETKIFENSLNKNDDNLTQPIFISQTSNDETMNTRVPTKTPDAGANEFYSDDSNNSNSSCASNDNQNLVTKNNSQNVPLPPINILYPINTFVQYPMQYANGQNSNSLNYLHYIQPHVPMQAIPVIIPDAIPEHSGANFFVSSEPNQRQRKGYKAEKSTHLTKSNQGRTTQKLPRSKFPCQIGVI